MAKAAGLNLPPRLARHPPHEALAYAAVCAVQSEDPGAASEPGIGLKLGACKGCVESLSRYPDADFLNSTLGVSAGCSRAIAGITP